MRCNISEVLRVNKYPDKRLEQLCAEKTSVTSNNKEFSHICKYSKEIETSQGQLQIHIDSLSKSIEINQCQENKENVVLKGELERVVDDRGRSVAGINNSVEEQNTNQVSAENLKATNDQQKKEISHLTEELKLKKSSVVDFRLRQRPCIQRGTFAFLR